LVPNQRERYLHSERSEAFSASADTTRRYAQELSSTATEMLFQWIQLPSVQKDTQELMVPASRPEPNAVFRWSSSPIEVIDA